MNNQAINKLNSQFSIPIFDNENNNIGSLSLIDNTILEKQDIIHKLTKWRRMFMRNFLTQFPATEERTKNWLKNIVIPSLERKLFLILDEKGNILGNFGICNLIETTAELDNIIRGERGGNPRLIYYAEIAILKWLYYTLNIQVVNLHVFSNNPITIDLHNSIGFKIINRVHLYKQSFNNEIHYSTNTSGEKMNFDYVEMKLTKKDFEKLNKILFINYKD